MTHQYNITGMTCNGCVAKVKSALLKLGDVAEAQVQLEPPQATITMLKHIDTADLQHALNTAGAYSITDADAGMQHHSAHTNRTNVINQQSSWIVTYKPILLIGAYIIGVTVLTAFVNGEFAMEHWMQSFMAAFFLVFSFFKLLDINGFADSYATYDVIAKRWRTWGLIYPFLELLLGIAYLIRFNPLFTNGATFILMSISIIGVLQSVLNKRKISCACLGTVFNLPMSTITIVEDSVMIAMSAVMLMGLAF